MQEGNELTDAGGRMIAEGLKGNCSVTKVGLVSLGGMLVRFELLTCADQRNIDGMSHSVKREIAEVLQEGHGADKGIAIAAFECRFYDFETCREIDVCHSKVRMLSR